MKNLQKGLFLGLTVLFSAVLTVGILPCINAAKSPAAAPVWYQNFESETGFSAGTGAAVIIDGSSANTGGAKCVKLTFESTGDPGNNAQCVNINPQSGETADGTSYKYLIFFILDTQGNNTHKVTVYDASNAYWTGWIDISSTKNKWKKIAMPLSGVTGINKAAIKEVRIGEWNAGGYYIDDLYFANSTSDELPSF